MCVWATCSCRAWLNSSLAVLYPPARRLAATASTDLTVRGRASRSQALVSWSHSFQRESRDLVVVAAYVFLCNSLRLSSRNSGLAAMSAFDNEPLAEDVEEGRSRRATGTTARDMGRLPNAASILSRSGRVGEICTSVVSEICCRASTERISRDARLGAKPTRSWARRNASKSANVIRVYRSLLEPVFGTWGKCRADRTGRTIAKQGKSPFC